MYHMSKRKETETKKQRKKHRKKDTNKDTCGLFAGLGWAAHLLKDGKGSRGSLGCLWEEM